eukprot:94898-Pelagomonas_calceolata.AAC.1
MGIWRVIGSTRLHNLALRSPSVPARLPCRRIGKGKGYLAVPAYEGSLSIKNMPATEPNQT